MDRAEIDVAELPALSTYKQTAKWTGSTDRHLANLIKAGAFPKPTYVGARSPRFRRSDLLQWLEDQANTEETD
jgi:predicted DNA-binding transcriptional regulator AlpA